MTLRPTSKHFYMTVSVSRKAGVHLDSDCISIRSCWDSAQCILFNPCQKREVGRLSTNICTLHLRIYLFFQIIVAPFTHLHLDGRSRWEQSALVSCTSCRLMCHKRLSWCVFVNVSFHTTFCKVFTQFIACFSLHYVTFGNQNEWSFLIGVATCFTSLHIDSVAICAFVAKSLHLCWLFKWKQTMFCDSSAKCLCPLFVV